MSGSVSDILTPFRKIKFGIFDNSNEQVDENKILWHGLVATFEAQVVAIDKRTNVLIDASFAELRSTEAALQRSSPSKRSRAGRESQMLSAASSARCLSS